MLLLFGAASLLPWASVRADGTETLGAPAIPIAAGSGVIAGGVGLAASQPGNVSITVPAGATVKQVLVYWEGQSYVSAAPDDTIEVNGNTIAGTLIGGPTIIYGKENPPGGGVFENVYTATFRADITAGNFVSPGPNVLSLGGLTFNVVNDGASIVVIYDDGSGGLVSIRDGNDFAWDAFLPTSKGETVEQTFHFPPLDSPRAANLSLLFASIRGAASGLGNIRPTRLELKIDGGVVANLYDAISSADGEEWDTLNLSVLFQAGNSNLSVRAFSENFHNPAHAAASFIWSAAALAISNSPPVSSNCVPPLEAKKWKANAPSGWAAGGYSPTQTLASVFDPGKLPAKSLTKTLLQAVDGKAGASKEINELLRHGVAALLNAADPLITYPQTVGAIVLEINMALMNGKAAQIALRKKYEAQNKQPCPGTGGGGNCYTSGKPNRLNLTLTGNNCASSANSQMAISGKTSCFEFNGGLTGFSPVRVIATSSSSEPTASTARYFDQNVNLGASFSVLSTPSSTFGANTYFYLYEGGVLKMRIQIHTSCSAPLINGETFGALRLDSYSN
jgi:hypothetical protein